LNIGKIPTAGGGAGAAASGGAAGLSVIDAGAGCPADGADTGASAEAAGTSTMETGTVSGNARTAARIAHPLRPDLGMLVVADYQVRQALGWEGRAALMSRAITMEDIHELDTS